MLFYMLQRYPNIRYAVINDINPDLITCYRTVANFPKELIESLLKLERTYYTLHSVDERKAFYLTVRDRYNEKKLDPIENTSTFLFLNRTCFNELYRVNQKGGFNVPFGKYDHPCICDADLIRRDSKILQSVEILCGDFVDTIHYCGKNTFFYFDPPYRPLSDTSSFNNYAKEPFNDNSQVRLKEFCDKIVELGYDIMLSNSDCKSTTETTGFFDLLYADYHIERVWASRSINANPNKRGKLTEILIHNYTQTKGQASSFPV